MASGKRICKVCGKEYDYCKTWLVNNKFRWQDVACSVECGAKYFAAIEASRAKDDEPAKVEPTVKKSSRRSRKSAKVELSEEASTNTIVD